MYLVLDSLSNSGVNQVWMDSSFLKCRPKNRQAHFVEGREYVQRGHDKIAVPRYRLKNDFFAQPHWLVNRYTLLVSEITLPNGRS